MKNESAVRHKLKQVRFRYIKKEIENLLKPSPSNCLNNLKGEQFQHCGLQDQPVLICDPRFHGGEVSGSCPNFSPVYNKDKIKESLNNFFFTSSIPDIAKRYPDMAALLWTLDNPDNRDWVLEDQTEEPPKLSPAPLVQLGLPAPSIKPLTFKNRLYNFLMSLGIISPPEK